MNLSHAYVTVPQDGRGTFSADLQRKPPRRHLTPGLLPGDRPDGQGGARHFAHLFAHLLGHHFREVPPAAACLGQSEKFIGFFRKSKRFSEVNGIASQLPDTPLTTLFRAGYAELDAQVKANRPEDPAVTAGGGGKLLIKNISGVERALERAITSEVSRLTKSMTFLATTASACPFIGLFGTVWGIMQSFRAIGNTGSTSIAAVAPGISEALINTAAGLAAAIPALIFYNYFMGKVRMLRAGMEDFALEFINLAERNFT